jgi:hypothetical protein
MRTTKLASVTLALVVGSGVAFAKDDSAIAVKEALSKVTVMEIPAKAADLVAQAPVAQRDATAVDVVKISLQKNPTIAPAVVGTIVRKSPETAPVVAATAASLQPKQAKLIAQAAASAAPTKAREIVKSVCKLFPKESREIAVAVAQVAPKQAQEILAGVADAAPELKTAIEQAVAGYGSQLTVGGVMDRVSSPASTPALPPVAAGPSATGAGRGPSVQPPYLPLSGTPNNVPPTSGDVPPGGRDYAAP